MGEGNEVEALEAKAWPNEFHVLTLSVCVLAYHRPQLKTPGGNVDNVRLLSCSQFLSPGLCVSATLISNAKTTL